MTDFKSDKITNDKKFDKKEYMRQYRIDKKEHLQELNKRWKEEHREQFNASVKAYKEKFNGFYLYKIVDNAENVLYVGQTTNIKTRISNHLCFNSNIADFMRGDEWESIYYIDVSNFVSNSKDLKDLETALIDYYKPAWNTQILKKEEEEKELLIDTLINNIDWNIYTIKK